MLRKRKCRICGEWYRPKVHNQKTCSKECSKELHKMSVKRWMKNNREKVNGYQKRWVKNNPEKRKEIERKWWDKYYSNREQNIEDIMNAYYEYLDECE